MGAGAVGRGSVEVDDLLSSIAWFFFWWTVVGSAAAFVLGALIRRADEGSIERELEAFADTLAGTPSPRVLSGNPFRS